MLIRNVAAGNLHVPCIFIALDIHISTRQWCEYSYSPVSIFTLCSSYWPFNLLTCTHTLSMTNTAFQCSKTTKEQIKIGFHKIYFISHLFSLISRCWKPERKTTAFTTIYTIWSSYKNIAGCCCRNTMWKRWRSKWHKRKGWQWKREKKRNQQPPPNQHTSKQKPCIQSYIDRQETRQQTVRVTTRETNR